MRSESRIKVAETALNKQYKELAKDAVRNFEQLSITSLQLRQFSILRNLDIIEIQDGIFKGMIFDPPIFEGGGLPRVLGTYESALQPHIAQAAGRRPRNIIDIGAAEGYYAVGLALLCPEATVYAYEDVEILRDACRVVAADNGASGRVVVRGRFTADEWPKLDLSDTLVLCDIEGGEFPLFDAAALDKLSRATLIVETHPTAGDLTAGDFSALRDRMRATHDVTIVLPGVTIPAIPRLWGYGELNIAAAVHEFRGNPTPWLVATPRAMT